MIKYKDTPKMVIRAHQKYLKPAKKKKKKSEDKKYFSEY